VHCSERSAIKIMGDPAAALCFSCFVGLLCAANAASYEVNYKPFVDFGRNYPSQGGSYRSFGGYSRFSSQGNSETTSTRDLFSDARDFSKSVKNILREVESNPDAVAVVDKVVRDNKDSCINSLEDGVKGIEKAVSLLDTHRSSIEALSNSVEAFVDIKEPTKILRESSRLLRLVQPLYNSDQGDADFDLDKMRCLAVIMDTLGTSKQLRLGSGKLREAARIVSATTSFLERLRSKFGRLETICRDADRELNADYILAIGDLSDDIADLYVALGSLQEGEKIRRGKKILRRVTEELSKVKDLGLNEFECNSPGSFSKVARTLEELANLIEDVGLDKLQEQLGVNISFLLS